MERFGHALRGHIEACGEHLGQEYVGIKALQEACQMPAIGRTVTPSEVSLDHAGLRFGEAMDIKQVEKLGLVLIRIKGLELEGSDGW